MLDLALPKINISKKLILIFIGMFIVALSVLPSPTIVHAQKEGSQGISDFYPATKNWVNLLFGGGFGPGPGTLLSTVGSGVELLKSGVGINGACAKDFFSAACVAQIVSWLVEIVLIAVGYILVLAALLFDKVKDLTLNPDTYSNIEVVKLGWTHVRNVANIFFIFILLIIAIATILRRESYGAKQLLVRLILVALFINFSYTITLYIILPANSLADFFVTTTLDNDKFRQYESTRDMIGALLHGLNPGVLYSLGQPPDPNEKEEDSLIGQIKTYSPVQDELKTRSVGTVLEGLLYNIAAMLLGIVVIVFTAFILLAAAFMFLLRIAVLWIIMIFSPLAFLFMVLPRTSSYADLWWKKLIDQAIFPAAFMFFFFIAVNIGASDIIKETVFNISEGKEAAGSFIQFLSFYIVILIILYIGLWAAREFGAYGATTAMGWASSLKKTATGAVGAIGAGTAYYTAGAAARKAQSALGEEGMARMQLSAVTRPVARLLDKTAGMGKRKELEETKAKAMMSLAPREFMARFSQMSNGEQDTILKNEDARKRLAKVREETKDDNEKKRIDATMARQSYQTQAKFLRESPKAFGEAFSKGGLRPEIMTDAIEQSNKETLQKMISNTSADKAGELVTAVAQISPRLAKDMVSVAPQFWKEAGLDITQAVRNIDLEKVKQESLDELEKMDNAFFRHASVSQRQKVMSEGGDNVLKPYLKQMDNVGSTSTDLANKLDRLGDKASAIQFKNSPVFNEIHGLKIEKIIEKAEEEPTPKDRARFDDMA